jgi:hypothetical protein
MIIAWTKANNTDRQDIIEILFKVPLITINQTNKAETIIEASKTIALLKIPSFFLDKRFAKVTCVSFYVDFV